MFEVYDLAVVYYQNAFDEISQLTNVARPVVIFEETAGGRGQTWLRHTEGFGEFRQKVTCQKRDVAAALTQRGYVNVDNVYAVV